MSKNALTLCLLWTYVEIFCQNLLAIFEENFPVEKWRDEKIVKIGKLEKMGRIKWRFLAYFAPISLF